MLTKIDEEKGLKVSRNTVYIFYFHCWGSGERENEGRGPGNQSMKHLMRLEIVKQLDKDRKERYVRISRPNLYLNLIYITLKVNKYKIRN